MTATITSIFLCFCFAIPSIGTTSPLKECNGTLDVLTGVLTVTHDNIASYAGETINEPWISSMDVFSAGTTPTTGAQVVYPLATPQTVQLTPQQVSTLLGSNVMWSDLNGDLTVQYKSN